MKSASKAPAHIDDPFPQTMEGDYQVRKFAVAKARRPEAVFLAKFAPGFPPTMWRVTGATKRMHPSIRRRILEHNWFLLPFALPFVTGEDASVEAYNLAREHQIDGMMLRAHLLEHDGEELTPDECTVRLWVGGQKAPTPKGMAYIRYLAAQAREEGRVK
ncbi:hypothetical protein [Polyangium sp. 15x6]|uniref:hypothetical protein n=1 Tax=Polyangium sp. 15x6 TaxID=3042687 RepID=UPI00249B8381|nr:hypothetical protein [Polyangium sp. 15x6]MDI3282131.1 hypothetical protein [Polyangium sp. 15x6]